MPPSSEENMDVVAFTEEISDLRVRYQLTYMKDSCWIWVQAGSEGPGNLRALSLATPRIMDGETLPPGTTILGGGADAASQGIAQKLASRCGITVWASIDLSGAEVVESVVFRRLLQEIQRRRER